ncbi:hypothetical protein EI94DRAFT_1701500 [Lactarius quietus]|nr:hypothetical protein EI94DRAFT_1701500 [Lactarius quietus]
MLSLHSHAQFVYMLHNELMGYTIEEDLDLASLLMDQKTDFVGDDGPTSNEYCFLCGNGASARVVFALALMYGVWTIQSLHTIEMQMSCLSALLVIRSPTEVTTIQTLRPAYAFPAKICGSAQLIPRSKFSSNGIVVLNFHLAGFHEDMGDLGKILEPFACAFIPKENMDLLIFEHITFDLEQGKLKHKRNVDKVANSQTLKTVIILITTHAANDTGSFCTSSSCHVGIKEWITQVITKPILDVISTLNAHWFFFSCGTLVNITSSFNDIKSFAHEYIFTTLTFHPIYATTFLIHFFQHIIIEDRNFDKTIGLLLSALPLSRHTGIVHFWTVDSAVKSSMGRSGAISVPILSLRPSLGSKGPGGFIRALKVPEGVWIAFGLTKSDPL